MIALSHASLSELTCPEGLACTCGRRHAMPMDYLRIGAGTIRYIPDALQAMGCSRPFIVCDINTKAAAWGLVQPVLESAGITYTLYCFRQPRLEPDEYAVGSLLLAWDAACDCVMGIGSGVINDCCKVLSHCAGVKQMIIGTAPSMDGYASNTAAMIHDHMKMSVDTGYPDAILCDIDIMKNAPMRMLQAGLGDMIAKYSAICEWRISHLVTGEYYCENIAAMIRSAVQKVTANAAGLNQRDPQAVQAVTEGLIVAGIGMSFAGVPRPAAGQEHFFSHMWDMFDLNRGLPCDLHGIHVGIGTLLTLKMYDVLRQTEPSRKKSEAFIASFDDAQWQSMIRRIYGPAADDVIEKEHVQYHKNDPAAHKQRLDIILAQWQDILRIMDEELPPLQELEALMQQAEMPMTPAELGFDHQDVQDALAGSRDNRNKYLLSSLFWDLGLLYVTELD
ncbi:MAG: sn-glycerol-1-phosphate dehydrogenase [Clostridia bacterium]|nr:sn-glycerol-1-phosphate dehydrogenase [Clostridia bacterium]